MKNIFSLVFFLQDILENESINLDWMFRYSLINDIVKVCVKNGDETHVKEGMKVPNDCLLAERSLVDAAFSSLVCLRDAQSKERNGKDLSCHGSV